MVGIVIGNMFAGIAESRFVIIGGLGASIAMAVSGIWGTYLSEKAERKKKLEELEKHMLTRLKKTKIGKASRLIPFVIAIIGGLIPFIASLIILFPLFVLPLSIAYLASVSIAFALLFGLGLYLGKLSKENVVIFGLKMVLAGLVAVLISFLLGVK
ncbi:MAG: hypothetical protein HZB67_01120 [Candidatus Aenigmarchaeota archaeon]|nr:hypothetical protein [Candidatus Aenigmarchaeota archaeon]